MNKRTRLVLGIIVGAVILFSGTLFGLAKYGVIKLKHLADPMIGGVEITVDPSNVNATVGFYQNGRPVSAPASLLAGTNTFRTSLPYGSYTYRFGMPENGQPCEGPVANLSHYSTLTRTTYPKFNCGTNVNHFLSGKVTDKTNGNAIAGASLNIASKSATSANDGTYYFDGITPGTYNALVTKLNYSAVNQTISPTQATNNIANFQMLGVAPPSTGAYSSTGNVKNSAGSYISEVDIRVLDSSGNTIPKGSTLSKESKAFDEGNYQTENFEQNSLDSLSIRFHKTNFVDQQLKLSDANVIVDTHIVGSGESVYQLKIIKDIILTAAASASENKYMAVGKVVDTNGNYLKDVEIKLTYNSDGSNSTATSSERGNFADYNLNHTKNFGVNFEAPNYSNASITLSKTDYRTQNLSLSETGVVENTRDLSGGLKMLYIKDVVLATGNGDAVIQGKIKGKDGQVLKDVTVGTKKNGWGLDVNTAVDITDTLFSQSELKATSDDNGNYSIIIPSNQIGDYLGSNYKVCSRINNYRSSTEKNNISCHNAENSVIKTINVRHDQTYIADIVFENYQLAGTDFTKFNLIGEVGEYDQWTRPEVSCENCNKGPWNFEYAESALSADDYIVRDVYNIAQQNSTIDRLKISIVFDFEEDREIVYFDPNNNYIKDDPNVVEITKSEIEQNSFIGQDGKLYLHKNLHMRAAGETGKNFVIFGSVKDKSGNLIAGAEISVEMPAGKVVDKARSDNSKFPNAYIPQYITNFEISTQPLHLDQNYYLRIDLPDANKLVNPIQWYVTISPDQWKYLDDQKLYYYDINYTVEDNRTSEIQIDYFATDQSGKTLNPVNLHEQKIYNNQLICELETNTGNVCAKSWKIDDTKNNRIIYQVNTAQLEKSRDLILNFMAGKYKYINGPLTTRTGPPPYNIELSSQDNTSVKCKDINSIEFCYEKNFDFSSLDESKITKIAELVKNIIIQSGSNQFPVILIRASDSDTSEYILAEAGQNKFNIGTKGQTTIIYIPTSLFSTNLVFTTIVHEISHILDAGYPWRKYQEIGFNRAISSAQRGNCDSYFDRHKCFASYGIRTNQNELRAVFFEQYINNNLDLQAAINDPAIPTECRNVLKYLYASLLKRHPGLNIYQQSATSVYIPDQNKNNQIASDSSTAFSAQKAHAASTFFDQIMTEAGYSKVNKMNINTVSNFDQMDLSPDQIAGGVWMAERYQSLPIKDRLQLRISSYNNLAEAAITRYSNLSSDSIRTILSTVNNATEQLLIRIGFNISNTKISGKVEDQDGPVAGLQIKLSEKSDITASNGTYNIVRTKTGILPLRLFDPKINKTFTASPASVSVVNNQQLSNINIIFTRKTFRLTGRVMIGDQPLSNGTITSNDNQVYAINSKGRFDFALKEGQYRLVIKNKNGKTMKITNSGSFNNLRKLDVTKNYNGMIWVK